MAHELDRYWFEPKRYGYGSCWPIAWQGWALCAAYSFVIAVAAYLILDRSLAAFLAIVGAATAALLIVCARTTRGGWRWRWGGGD